METERWQKLRRVFADAIALDGHGRERLLQAHARVDPDLASPICTAGWANPRRSSDTV